ncbi:hypothetical protein GGR54DRAFT_631640 [Hypoxylon sp. NC1633]|nr:hypothetical protein GGR54DRAFT_631640 [Hypoxylon sp. NC1633]
MDLSSNPSTLTTIGGWVVIVGIGGALWYRSQQKKKKISDRRGSFSKQSAKHSDAEPVADIKKKTDKIAKPKPKAKAPTSTENGAIASTSIIDYNRDEDEAADKKADREFARQLANTHAGTKFNSKKSEEKRQKSVKQSKAQEISENSADKTSVPSSHADDADDDLSPQTSPVVEATSGDVSDMLEPVPSGPSVLRLTDVDSVKKPKQRQQKAAEPAETKKQRQNRKKAEAAKAAREEEEKERKVKMEQQRRTARISEGRAAQDGSASMANTQNAWSGKSTNGADVVQPLDTFDQQPKAEVAKPEVAKPAVSSAKGKSDRWLSNVPSEEEQMEMLRQEDSWNEVKTKKKGKKKDTPVEASVPSTNGGSAVTTPPVNRPTPVNGNKKPLLTSSNSSFAALTPEGTDDNEEEEEWDV